MSNKTKRKRRGTPPWIGLFTCWFVHVHKKLEGFTAEEAYEAYCTANPDENLWPSFSAFKLHAKSCNVQFKPPLNLTRNVAPRRKDRTRTLAVVLGSFFEELEEFIQAKLGETVRFGEQRKTREVLLQIIEARGLFAPPKNQKAETELCENQDNEESENDDD